MPKISDTFPTPEEKNREHKIRLRMAYWFGILTVWVPLVAVALAIYCWV